MKANEQSAKAEFAVKIESFIAKLRKSASTQFAYNLTTNIPNNVAGITFSNAAEHALNCGIVSTFNSQNGFDCHAALLMAHHILEDANCHTEAKVLVPFIPEYQ